MMQRDEAPLAAPAALRAPGSASSWAPGEWETERELNLGRPPSKETQRRLGADFAVFTVRCAGTFARELGTHSADMNWLCPARDVRGVCGSLRGLLCARARDGTGRVVQARGGALRR